MKKNEPNDWFSYNIPYDDEQFLARLAVKTLETIEKNLGIIYYEPFIGMMNKLKNQNYKQVWEKEKNLIK